MLEIAIIGAGPYGLSLAAHLRHQGIAFRIFGRPMDSWVSHMPKGMALKSDGFASNIYDPTERYTLKHFCAERGIEYSDAGIPVRLETFAAYGLNFKERQVPELEDKLLVSLERLTGGGFLLKLDNGETAIAKRVILAVGITHFRHLPPSLALLPSEFVSHSFRHAEITPFRGRNVTVIGGGSSATDLAGLLHELGAQVQLVARQTSLKFHGKPEIGKPRPLWQRIRNPQSGLGPGWRSRFFANSPSWFHRLPQRLRLEIVKTHLGPSGGWFAKDKIIGRVPLCLGFTPEQAQIQDKHVRLRLRGRDGTERQIVTEHVIAATGYKVDLGRLPFLSADLCSKIKAVDRTPVLSSSFESSIPGLYFVGIAAANSFGPVMRFAFGAGFAARHLTRVLAKSVSKGREFSPVFSSRPTESLLGVKGTTSESACEFADDQT